MIARHFRPQAGDFFVNFTGQHLQIEVAEQDYVTTKNGTYSKHGHRKLATHSANMGPVWFYPREGGAGLL
jgi:hypothetical protein